MSMLPTFFSVATHDNDVAGFHIKRNAQYMRNSCWITWMGWKLYTSPNFDAFVLYVSRELVQTGIIDFANASRAA